MSSTARGAARQEMDYYATDPAEVVKFLKVFLKDEPTLRAPGSALDPCAGGNIAPIQWQYQPKKPPMLVPATPMAYPAALAQVLPHYEVVTNDIRLDSPAEFHTNALFLPEFTEVPFDLVITNPPFSIALDVIQAGLEMVKDNGFVVMLLRLNFLGSNKRFPWMSANMPYRLYVHHERMSFTPDGGADSIEYGHFVWKKGARVTETLLKLV